MHDAYFYCEFCDKSIPTNDYFVLSDRKEYWNSEEGVYIAHTVCHHPTGRIVEVLATSGTLSLVRVEWDNK